MPLLKRLRTIAAKVEATIGTAETLAAAQGVYNAYDPMIQADITVEEREAQGSFDYLSGVAGARGGTMTFRTDMGWDGSGHPTWASVLFPACGYVATGDVYYPTSEAPGTNVKTVTIGIYENGVYKLLAGAMGNFRIVAPAGEIVFIEWEFRGVWQPPTDVALIAPTYPTDLPLRFGSATVTYNSIEQCVQTFTFDAGNEVILRECPDTAAGYKSALVVNRQPRIIVDPEAQLVATEDRYGQWIANTEQAFSCAIDGPTGAVSNGAVTIAAPKAQHLTITESDRDRLVTDEIEFACNKNAATKDQDVSITFTDKADA